MHADATEWSDGKSTPLLAGAPAVANPEHTETKRRLATAISSWDIVPDGRGKLLSPPYSGGLYFKLTGVAQGFELA